MRREAARAAILLWGRGSDFPAQGGPFPVHGWRDRADTQHGKIGIPVIFPSCTREPPLSRVGRRRRAQRPGYAGEHALGDDRSGWKN
jgi:hypothetical protein